MAAGFLSTGWFRRLKYAGVGSAVFLAAMFVYFPNYARLKKLKEENLRLTQANQQLEAEIADYEAKLLQVDKDSYVYEKIARDELGIARDNEIVIDIEQ